MEFKVKINSNEPVNLRTGSSFSSPVSRKAYYGAEYTIDEMITRDGISWLHIKNTDEWFIGGDSSNNGRSNIEIIDSDVANKSTSQETPQFANADSTNKSLPTEYSKQPDSKVVYTETINTKTVNYGYLGNDDRTEYSPTYSGNGNDGVQDLTYGSVNNSLNSINVSSEDLIYNLDFEKAMNDVKKNNNANFFKNSEQLTLTLSKYTNMYNIEFPDAAIGKTFTKIFFTRPDLNLFDPESKSIKLLESIDNDPTYHYAYYRNPLSLQLLTANYTADNDLNLLLSDRCRSFDVADENIETQVVGENVLGYKMLYGKSMNQSLTAGTFNITISDTRDAVIYLMLNGWVKYISDVFHGIHSPSKDHRKNKEIDYMCSCYYFVLAEDGETLLYFTKYYGVFPINIPSSSFSKSVGSMINNLDYNIQFGYCFKDPISVMTLHEFNLNSVRKKMSEIEKETAVSGWNDIVGHSGSTFAGMPYIIPDRSPLGNRVYKLKYRYKA